MAAYTSKVAFVQRGIQPLPPPDPNCSICHEELHAPFPSFETTRDFGDTHVAVKVVRCGHVYGAKCLHTWLETANTCPICRGVLFPRDGQRSAQNISLDHIGAQMQHINAQILVVEARQRVREQLNQQYPGYAGTIPALSSATDLLYTLQGRQFQMMMSVLEANRRIRADSEEELRAESDAEINIDSMVGDGVGAGAATESNADSTQGQMGSVIDVERHTLASSYCDSVVDSGGQQSNFNSLMDNQFSIIPRDGSMVDFQGNGNGEANEGQADDNGSATSFLPSSRER
jgi:hypothetical protein